jgi:hypothetical protein
MGFFGGLMRIAKGEPVFQPPKPGEADTPDKPTGLAMGGDPHPQQLAGPKELPNVYIERYEFNNGADHLECEFHIHNHSHKPVRLERLEFLGQQYGLNKTYLQPEQEWEYSVHAGHRPTSTNFTECKLYFETEDGDDFVAVHRMEYQQLPDRTFTVSHIRFMSPVRDI